MITIHVVLSLRAALFKEDSVRRVDRVIDYFGDTTTAPAGRATRASTQESPGPAAAAQG